ncbi:MAG TPA: FlgD immunoglobulin-like domain containing protein [Candidatus Krumholzibacteria bacterium]|nr:FlgD immunoglobulin-like domain containing protein [Candidatus Krumholzibacteria bacterium]HPD70269.1 FlgD immunoglobulin-like domain containing protein [Candidatus Krumholzibacteria bacterium]HRY40031.1 FlgD immunoglobulin-like domain containing protein [Candidatus Krumholzibacteria bacterium]
MNRSAFAVGAILTVMCMFAHPATADCLPYGDYLHWAGGMGRTGVAWRVTVANGYGYLASGDLQVVDVTDPQDLHVVATVPCPGCTDVTVVGTSAYALMDAGELIVVDVADPREPRILGTATLGGLPYGVVVAGPYAYVANAHLGLQIVDVAEPANPVYRSRIALAGEAHHVVVAGGVAFVATYEAGLTVIDVADPGSPRVIASLPTMGFACDVALVADHLYVANAGLTGGTISGLEVVDVSDPDQPEIVAAVITGEWAEGVAVANQRAFIANRHSGLQVVDVTDPHSPQLVGAVAVGPLWGVAVDGDRVYAAGSNWMLHVIEIGCGENAPLLGSVGMPDSVYGLALMGKHAVVADRVSGVEIVDVSDPHAPAIVAHVDLFWSLGAAVAGEYAYVTADYGPRRLYVIDLADPLQPLVVGAALLADWAFGVAVDGGYAYVADSAAGLDIVDITDPSTPHVVGVVDTPGSAYAVAVAGNHAYVADFFGFQIIDVSVPSHAWITGSAAIPATGVAVRDDVVFVTDALGLHILDVSDPTSPQEISLVATSAPAVSVTVVGDWAYVGAEALEVIDIADLARPQLVGSVGRGGEVAVDAEHVYVGSVDARFQVAFQQCLLTPVAPGSDSNETAPGWLLAVPNPTRGEARFHLNLTAPVEVKATVYDVAGRRVRSLPPRALAAGANDVIWDGRDDRGRDVPGGVYLIRVTAGQVTRGARIVLAR